MYVCAAVIWGYIIGSYDEESPGSGLVLVVVAVVVGLGVIGWAWRKVSEIKIQWELRRLRLRLRELPPISDEERVVVIDRYFDLGERLRKLKDD